LGQNILLAGRQLEAHMRASIACPSTGKVVTIEIMTDAQTVAESWRKFIRFKCPRCKDRHAIPFKEVYVHSLLTSLHSEPAGMFQMPVAASK
jgi:phage FluMu protein Com